VALLIPATVAGTMSTAYAGDLYLLGPDGSGFILANPVLVIVLVVALLVSAQAYTEWQRDESHRRAQAEAWEAARYYHERTEEARTLTQTLDADTDRIEEEIRVICDRFEQSDREEASKHESAKRALANRGERS
jgi:hypothetical protein